MREGKRREEEERKRRQMKYDMRHGNGRIQSYQPQPVNSRIHSAPSVNSLPNSVNSGRTRVSSQPQQPQQPHQQNYLPNIPPAPQNQYVQQALPQQHYANDGRRVGLNDYVPPQQVPQQQIPSQRRPIPVQQQLSPQHTVSSPTVSLKTAHTPPQQMPQPRTSIGSVESAPQQDSMDVQIATQLFHNHDVKKMGRLTAEELQNLLQNDDNTQFCISAVDALINLFGASRFGTVNFNEFVSLYKRVKKWRKVYVDNDINGSFTISASEFHNSLQELGYLVPFEVSEKLFDQYAEFVDHNNNGKELKFDKFVETLVWLMRLTKVFRKYDGNQEGIASIHYKEFIDVALYLGRFLPH